MICNKYIDIVMYRATSLVSADRCQGTEVSEKEEINRKKPTKISR